MRYYQKDFLTIKWDDVVNAIGQPILYKKNGVLYNGVITAPQETEVLDIPLSRGKKESFIGIRIDGTYYIGFNDINIEYVEFPVFAKD